MLKALTVCVVVLMRARTRRAEAESPAASLVESPAESMANRVATASPLHCAAMRRLVLLFLILILPLQWSWAAVASVCLHETGSAAQHLGHHDHEHAAVLDDTTADTTTNTTADTGGVKVWFDADCCSYHGLSMASLISVPAAHPVCNGSVLLGYSAHSRPDHVPDQPLRPPLPRPV